MKYLRKIKIALVGGFFIATAMMLGSTSILYAANELPHTFTPGTTISSTQVNANFQALLTRIEALEAQLAPVSIVGTYDFVSVGAEMSIADLEIKQYFIEQSAERGTLVFAAADESGHYHVTLTATSGGNGNMEITNDMCVMVDTVTWNPGALPYGEVTYTTENSSLIEASLTSGDTENWTGTYTVSGSTVNIKRSGEVDKIGTLSADGKMLILSLFDSTNKETELMIAIRRP